VKLRIKDLKKIDFFSYSKFLILNFFRNLSRKIIGYFAKMSVAKSAKLTFSPKIFIYDFFNQPFLARLKRSTVPFIRSG